MQSIVLSVKRRWSWKVFLVLVALLVPAGFAILPFELSRQQAFGAGDSVAGIGWETLLIDRLINIVLVIVLGGLGLVLANRIGLGMPFVQGRVQREALPYRFRHVVAIAWITAVALVLTSFLVRTVVFDPFLDAMYQELGITIPTGAQAPPLHGLLASFAAGITEETVFRLFGLSLLAWLCGLLFHDADGRPRAAVFWTANIVFSLAFGAAHLPTAAGLGLPMNALVIGSTLFGNGIAGLAFGWLFWTFGLESAMLAHFFADAIVHMLIPLISVQVGEIARYATAAVVAVVILVALMWALDCLVRAGRVHSTRMTW